MALRDRIPFLGKKAAGPDISIEPYGGDVRPAVMGPSGVSAALSRLAMVRAILTSAVAFIALAIIVTTYLLVQRMDTRLYVADGTPFGCPVTKVEDSR